MDNSSGVLVIKTAVDNKGFKRDLKSLQADVEKYGNIGASLIDENAYYGKDMFRNLNIADEVADEITKGFDNGIGDIGSERLLGQMFSSLDRVKIADDFAEEITKGFGDGFNNAKSLTKSASQDIAKELSQDVAKSITEGISKGVVNSADGISSGLTKSTSEIGTALTGVLTKSTTASGMLKNSLSAVLKIGTKLIIPLIAVATIIGGVMLAISLIGQAIEKLMNENAQFKTDVQYVIWALSQAMAPVLDWIAGIVVKIFNVIVKIIKYIAAIIKLLTGYNIFENASAQAFADHLKDAKNNASGINKNLKEVKKQLAGFDEMNVLNDTSDGGSGGVGLASMDFTIPDTDLSDFGKEIEEISNFVDDLKGKWETLGKAVNEVPLSKYIEEYGLWGIALKGLGSTVYGFFETIIGQIEMAQGLWDVVVGYFTGDDEKLNQGLDKLKEGFFTWLDGFKNEVIGWFEIQVGVFLGSIETFWNKITGKTDEGANKVTSKIESSVWGFVWKIIQPAVDFVLGVFKWSWDTTIDLFKWNINLIKDIFMSIVTFIYNFIIKPILNYWDWLYKTIVNGTITAINTVKNIFNNALTFISNIISKITGLFKNIGTNVGNAIGDTFKVIINSVLDWITNKINGFLKNINNAIDYINAIPLVNIPKLKMVSFPRLAKGGIVNMPGRGVPVGSAIAGERGMEGVIPLTDSQQMDLLGEAIGKHITINATIPVYAYNRKVDQQIKRIKAEDDFAFNR